MAFGGAPPMVNRCAESEVFQTTTLSNTKKITWDLLFYRYLVNNHLKRIRQRTFNAVGTYSTHT
jgi:hypothetical protein